MTEAEKNFNHEKIKKRAGNPNQKSFKVLGSRRTDADSRLSSFLPDGLATDLPQFNLSSGNG